MARLVHSYAEDFCCLRVASLPLLNQGMTLILGDNRDTKAAVNNGAGKTTLAKTICWGYFGETLDHDKFDEVIRWGTKRAYVRQVFEHDGTLWIVRRERSKGSPKLSLSRAKTKKFNVDFEAVEQVLWDGSPAEIQAKIEELLGKDFRAFCNTQFFGQGDIGRFFSSTDSVQKETIHRVLRSDIFRRTEKYMREKVMKGYRQVVTDLEADLRSVRDKMEEHDVTTLRKQSDEFDEYCQKRIESLLADINDTRVELQSRVRLLESDRSDLEAREAELSSKLDSIDRNKLRDDLTEASAMYDSYNVSMRKRAERIGELRAHLKSQEESLRLLDGKVCPTCSSPLDRGAPEALKKSLRKWLVDGAAETTMLRTEQSNDETEKARCESRIDELSDAINEFDRGVNELVRVRQEIEGINRSIDENRRHATEKANELLKQMSGVESETNPYKERLTEVEARVLELDNESGRILSELTVAEKELAIRDFWLNAFGPQGIPSMLLDSVMPFLTERSNYHLETLTDGDITVEITNQRDLKKRGAKKEEISISCNIEGVPNSKPSVGQRKKLELATNMALMDLAVARDGESDFLMMDDVLDGLDSEGEARVLTMLEGLRAKRSSLFVATHESGFEEAFERALIVTKENQSSTVSEVK